LGFKYLDDLSSFELVNAIDGGTVEEKIENAVNRFVGFRGGFTDSYVDSIEIIEYHNSNNEESFGLAILNPSKDRPSIEYFYEDEGILYYSPLCDYAEYLEKESYLSELKQTFPDFVDLEDPIYNHDPKQDGLFISREQVIELYDNHKVASKEWFEIKDTGVVDQDMEWLNNPSDFKYQSDYKTHYESSRNMLLMLDLENHDSLDQIESSIREVEFKKGLYWYEMKARPVSIGCQPDGFIEFDDDKGRNGIVAYDRPLTDKELDEFEMGAWKEKKTYKDMQELDL